jgi:hypothetical protein
MSALVLPAIRYVLTQTAAITAVVPADRILTAYRDGSGLPAILITPEADEAVSPAILRTDRLRRCSVEIAVIADTLKAARETAEIVRVAVHGAKGTYSGLTIFEIRESGINSTYDIGAEATEKGIHIATVQADAYYRAAAVDPTTIAG